MRRSFAERAAINAPIQGGAADIIKRAMLQLPAALKTASLNARMLLQVHDELVFELPRAESDKTIAVVKTIMESAATLDVPLVVDCGVGSNWLRAITRPSKLKRKKASHLTTLRLSTKRFA